MQTQHLASIIYLSPDNHAFSAVHSGQGGGNNNQAHGNGGRKGEGGERAMPSFEKMDAPLNDACRRAAVFLET